VDLAKVIAPEADFTNIGIRPGEKLHEVLISEDEARSTVELEDMFVVQPSGTLWFGHGWQDQGQSLPDGFHYSSDTNPNRLNVDQIRAFVAPFELEHLRETEG
jgi:UDP-N-acetylglucosamine 4,6-dehydratase